MLAGIGATASRTGGRCTLRDVGGVRGGDRLKINAREAGWWEATTPTVPCRYSHNRQINFADALAMPRIS